MEAINFALMMIDITQMKKKVFDNKKQRLSEAFSILKVCFGFSVTNIHPYW